VEVQSNATVDRAIFGGFTEVGMETKLDKAAHFGHNVIAGARCMLAAHCVIGGSTIIGDDVWIGPSAVIRNSIVIGDGARVSLGAVVTRDVDAGGHVSGNFAVDHAQLLNFIRTIR
jgi:UDP-3-O-[3-hydroxymyristoyl] glucosamine N-acyltransferase